MRVGALVQGVLDVTAASPRRFFFEVLQHFATSELEVDRLEYFATPAGRDDLYTYNQKEGLHQAPSPCHFKAWSVSVDWITGATAASKFSFVGLLTSPECPLLCLQFRSLMAMASEHVYNWLAA